MTHESGRATGRVEQQVRFVNESCVHCPWSPGLWCEPWLNEQYPTGNKVLCHTPHCLGEVLQGFDVPNRADIGSRWVVPCSDVAFFTWSTPRSGGRPDSHRDPQTSSHARPNRDYRMGHVGIRLRASGHNWLPTRLGQEGRKPTGDLG